MIRNPPLEIASALETAAFRHDVASVAPVLSHAVWTVDEPTRIGPATDSPAVSPAPASVGEVASTGPPVPVAMFPSPAATPEPSPEMPVEMGSPVPLVSVTADGVPRFGVVNVGEVANTGLPEPVAAFAKPVATPDPSPETPVEIGRPVPLVSVTDDGVPKAGVASVGELERTTDPEPVEVVAPVPPFAAVRGFCSVRLLNVGDGNI